MATTYVPAYRGYITDVPQIWFKRNDGKVFHFDKISQANITPTVNYTEVNGGWSLYPVAYLPAQSTMEMTFTSAQFSTDLFSMTNARDFSDKCVYVPHTVVKKVTGKTLEIEDVKNVDFVNVPAHDPDSVSTITKAIARIDGLKLGVMDDGETQKATPAAGEYIYTMTPGSAEGTAKITFTFNDTDANGVLSNKDVEIFYETVEENIGVRIDNKTSAVGELIAKYPVYADGTESDAAGVKGHVLVRIFRCRATAMPKQNWAA